MKKLLIILLISIGCFAGEFNSKNVISSYEVDNLYIFTLCEDGHKWKYIKHYDWRKLTVIQVMEKGDYALQPATCEMAK